MQSIVMIGLFFYLFGGVGLVAAGIRLSVACFAICAFSRRFDWFFRGGLSREGLDEAAVKLTFTHQGGTDMLGDFFGSIALGGADGDAHAND